MRTTICKLVSLVSAGTLLSAAAFGRVPFPFYDSFDYTPGNSLVQESSSWSYLGSSGLAPVTVFGGSLASAVGMPPSQGASITFQAAANAEDVQLRHEPIKLNRVFYSFVYDATPGANASYAISLGNGSEDKGRLFARIDGGQVRFGLSKGEDAPEAEASFTVPPGEHFLVLKWEHGDTDTLSLFIDPDPEGTEPAPDVIASAGLDAALISEFRIRQDLGGHAGALDEMRLGLSWYSVTDPLFSVNGLFRDHMVLQRDTSVPVWGRAKNGTRVTVQFGGESYEATVADDQWRVDLPPTPAGGPYDLIVVGGPYSERFSDVLIGDVWVCSGQSNMGFALLGCENGAQAVAGSFNPQLRLCEVTPNGANLPLADVGAGWVESSPGTSATYSGVAWFFGSRLQQDLSVPIGLIEADVNATSITTWMTNASLLSDPDFGKYAEQKLGSTSPNRPTARYNGMIAGMQPFAVRGVAWYQGEADIGKSQEYRKLFPAMLDFWRQDWGQERLPFLFVQLPAYGGAGSKQWPGLREAQLNGLELPDTAMVVTMDIGDPVSIHPLEKQPLGERLALAARAVALGEPLVHAGPSLSAVRAGPGGVVALRFASNGSGLTVAGAQLEGFELAGLDGVFHPAGAQLVGAAVLVQAAAVPRPTRLHYGWAGYPLPEINLANVEGLPASPFRVRVPEYSALPGEIDP